MADVTLNFQQRNIYIHEKVYYFRKQRRNKLTLYFCLHVYTSFIPSFHHACGRGNWTRHRIVSRPVRHLASGSMSKRSTAGGTRSRCRGCSIRSHERHRGATARGRVGAYLGNRAGVHGRGWRSGGRWGIGSYWLTAGCNCKKNIQKFILFQRHLKMKFKFVFSFMELI